MTKNMKKIDEMLETAIEIEGLIRIIRDGEPREETYELLRRKTGELRQYVFSTREQENQSATFLTGEAKSQRDREPEGMSGEIPEMAVEMEKEADVRMEEAEDIEMEASQEGADQDAGEDDIILSLEDDNTESSTSETDDTPRSTEDTSKSTEKKTGVRNLKAGFSLNDRFLYARELFDNNMKTFDSTLKSLEGVDDFGVIEDYFYNELDWDRENPTVKEFMEKLKPMHNA